jgi:integrase
LRQPAKERTFAAVPSYYYRRWTILKVTGAATPEFVWGNRWTSWSNNKRALDLKLDLKPWRLHDLRRSAATLVADQLDILPHIIEAILNHVSGHKSGVAGIYNKAKYELGMRRALQDWADYVTKLEKTGSDIIPPT